MDADFIRERITQLRLQKYVSEYKMSYDLGHCRGYINNISSGKDLPSMTEFLAICDYFEITSAQFFDTRTEDPRLYQCFLEQLGSLNSEDMKLILAIINRLQHK